MIPRLFLITFVLVVAAAKAADAQPVEWHDPQPSQSVADARNGGRFAEGFRLVSEQLAQCLTKAKAERDCLALRVSRLQFGVEAELWDELGESGATTLAMARKVLPANHRGISTSLLNLARIEQARGRPEQAQPLLEEALAVRVAEAAGEAHEDVAFYEYDMANNLKLMGKTNAALTHYQRSTAILRQVRGSEDPDLGLVMFVLANTHRDLGDYAGALGPYRESLRIALANGGDRTETAADRYRALGLALQFVGDKTGAEFVQKAVEVEAGLRSSGGTQSAEALISRGQYEFGEARYDLAQESFLEAGKIFEASHGRDSNEFAWAAFNFARALNRSGRSAEVSGIFADTVPVLEVFFGPADIKTGRAFVEWGLNQQRTGDYGGALRNYIKALNLFRDTLGESNPETIFALGNLSIMALRDLRDEELALGYFRQLSGSIVTLLGDRGDKDFGRAEYKQNSNMFGWHVEAAWERAHP